MSLIFQPSLRNDEHMESRLTNLLKVVTTMTPFCLYPPWRFMPSSTCRILDFPPNTFLKSFFRRSEWQAMQRANGQVESPDMGYPNFHFTGPYLHSFRLGKWTWNGWGNYVSESCIWSLDFCISSMHSTSTGGCLQRTATASLSLLEGQTMWIRSLMKSTLQVDM